MLYARVITNYNIAALNCTIILPYLANIFDEKFLQRAKPTCDIRCDTLAPNYGKVKQL